MDSIHWFTKHSPQERMLFAPPRLRVHINISVISACLIRIRIAFAYRCGPSFRNIITFDHGVNGLLIMIRNWMWTNHYDFSKNSLPPAKTASCRNLHCVHSTMQIFEILYKIFSKFFEIIFKMFWYNSRKFPKYFSKFLHKIILEVSWNNF